VSHATEDDVLVIGAGAAGLAHVRALLQLGVTPRVIGRGQGTARAFEQQSGVPVVTGGIENAVRAGSPLPRRAVVAVPVLDLCEVTVTLLSAGVREILVEKPVGLHRAQIAAVATAAEAAGARVFAAYNRRFYVAASEARRLAAEDGGVRSLAFEFTERSHIVAGLAAPHEVKQEWLLANSSHVIDLAFHLAGAPVHLDALRVGSMPWHSRGAAFVGSGMTAAGAVFSYRADWRGPGGWSVELTTAHRRLLLEPLERLRVADRTDPEYRLHDADYSPDDRLKPGFLEQMRSFLGDKQHLPDVHQHLDGVVAVVEAIRDGAAQPVR
jgi:predicted dehydrogenase